MSLEKLADGYGLIEGPTWWPGRGLLFSDVVNGGVHLLGPDGEVGLVLPHRRGIGGIKLHEAGGLVISGRNVGYRPLDGGDAPEPYLSGENAPEALGFNDIGSDPDGRLYVGSLAFRPVGSDDEPKPGRLYMIDLDGSATVQAEGIMLTNGIGVSPDGRVAYHSDTRTGAVWAYDRAADGTLADRRRFAETEGFMPDGLAMATDGSVWVADARGGRVVAFAPDGAVRTEVEVERPMVTSVCFGGEGLADLYIVTGSDGTGREDAGAIYRTRVDAAGQPVPLARTAIPGES